MTGKSVNLDFWFKEWMEGSWNFDGCTLDQTTGYQVMIWKESLWVPPSDSTGDQHPSTKNYPLTKYHFYHFGSFTFWQLQCLQAGAPSSCVCWWSFTPINHVKFPTNVCESSELSQLSYLLGGLNVTSPHAGSWLTSFSVDNAMGWHLAGDVSVHVSSRKNWSW